MKRPEPTGDKEVCEHKRYDHRNSDKHHVCFYCKDCGESWYVTRPRFEEAKNTSKEVESYAASNNLVQRMVDKIVEPTAIPLVDARTVVELFGKRATQLIDDYAKGKLQCVDTNMMKEILDDTLSQVIEDRERQERTKQSRPSRSTSRKRTSTGEDSKTESTAYLSTNEHMMTCTDLEMVAYPAFPHRLYEHLPIIDIWKDPGVWAIPDGGCNSSCHSAKWRENAQYKLEQMGRGYQGLIEEHDSKTFAGLGKHKSSCAGRFTFPAAWKAKSVRFQPMKSLKGTAHVLLGLT